MGEVLSLEITKYGLVVTVIARLEERNRGRPEITKCGLVVTVVARLHATVDRNLRFPLASYLEVGGRSAWSSEILFIADACERHREGDGSGLGGAGVRQANVVDFGPTLIKGWQARAIGEISVVPPASLGKRTISGGGKP